MKHLVIAIAAAPLLVAAASPWQAKTIAAAAPFIDKANDEWTRAIVTGDADTLSAPYDVNGIFVRPDGSEIRGRDAVRAMYAKPRSGAKVLNAKIHSDGRVAADADDVYEWGKAVMTVQAGDTRRQASGRYLTVWHRSAGRWAITHNIAF